MLNCTDGHESEKIVALEHVNLYEFPKSCCVLFGMGVLTGQGLWRLSFAVFFSDSSV